MKKQHNPNELDPKFNWIHVVTLKKAKKGIYAIYSKVFREDLRVLKQISDNRGIHWYFSVGKHTTKAKVKEFVEKIFTGSFVEEYITK